MENIIRELSLRLLNIIAEQDTDLAELLNDPNKTEIIDESIEIVTDESLKILDDYITSLENVDLDELS